LLFKDDVNERRETRLAKPLGRPAVLREDAREVFVARGQMAQPFGVRLRI
jgi:hypothetical protein